MPTLIFDFQNRDYKKEYREGYLTSPHWKHYRAMQLVRFHCCVFCWYFFSLVVSQRDVHHLTYRNRGHETDDDSVVICRRTHEEVQDIPACMLIEAREAYRLAFPL